jgi:hypothetical protein
MAEHKEPLKTRLKSEIRTVFQLTLYFGIWFSALNLLIHETQGNPGLPLESWGFAWIKAALCAKFMLIGQMVFPMPKVSRDDIWRAVLPRSVLYLLVVIFLNLLEEGIRGMLEGHSFMQAMAGYANHNPLHFLALTWVYWLILMPYLLLGRLLSIADKTD